MYIEKINSPQELKKLNISQLEVYAQEIREFLIDVVTKNGGHLASNLGVVELTIALHYVFDCPTDKILFDVGHQAYVHKIITGRKDGLLRLRQDGGVSGFPSPNESDTDPFVTGHSSTSLSLGLGMARARDLMGESYNILPVIGDGAFTGGMVFEALNDIGENKTKMTMILNDNRMSISKNISAISRYFTRLRLSRSYNKFRADIKKTLSALPFVSVGKDSKLRRAKGRVKEFFLESRLFENFGVSYYGPIDGHNLRELISVLRRASLKERPAIIHLVTKKGKGYKPAEECPEKFHGLSACPVSAQNAPDNAPNIGQNNTLYNQNNALYIKEREKDSESDNKAAVGADSADSDTKTQIESVAAEQSFSTLVGETLCRLADTDDKVVAITAAMALGSGLDIFARRHKDRYFDVSIAEQHAVSLAAGLAKSGFKPFFAVYSTFLQRGFDQLLHEVSLNKLPVRFLIDRAGAVGSDGATHQGIFDLSYLSLVPNMTILTPKDGAELVQMLRWAADFDAPLAIRYPKSYVGSKPVWQQSEVGKPIELGKWSVEKTHNSPIYLLACGNRMIDLAQKIQNVNVINARFVKPLDEELLAKINKQGNLIVTLEDNVLQGGFGQAVLSYLNKTSIYARIINFAHPDRHILSRDVATSLNQSGITEKELNSQILAFLQGE